MKVIERIFVKRPRNVVKLDDMHGKETVDANVILRQMLEKYEMAGRK